MKNRYLLILLSFFLFPFQGCYIVKQGVGQFKLRLEQVPLEEAIANEKNSKYKQLLASIPKIKQFAIHELKLKDNDNYSDYFATSQKGIAFVVTACRKNELIPHTWWFPIIGSVPYKGYFDEEDALDLEKELQTDGYDTWMFVAPAYSTLGWFKDPITTPMLERGDYYLAETVIHEMTHTTLYIKDQGDFNEQLASFVGQKGAYLYLKKSNLYDDGQIRKIKKQKQRSKEFAQIIRNYIPILEELYQNSETLEEAIKKRKAIFSSLVDEVATLYPHVPKTHWKFNNARILQYRRYHSEQKIFNELWGKSRGDWSLFWKLVSEHVKEKKWLY